MDVQDDHYKKEEWQDQKSDRLQTFECSISERQKTPIDIVKNMKKSEYCTVIGMWQAFHSIPLKEDSKKYTIFNS